MRLEKYLAIKKWCWITTISILTFYASSVYAQTPKVAFKLKFSISTDALSFATDKVQQIYLISPTNEVIKYAPDGTEQFRYNNNFLGILQNLDATNPFNLLLFYPDFQTLVTLDRTLSETGRLNLFDLNINFIKTVATSNDNQIWLYDDVSFQLKQIDAQGNLIIESVELNQLLPNFTNVTQMIARNNELYINDPNQGIFIFDRFAQFSKQLEIKSARFFQVIDDQLLALIEDELVIFDLTTFRSATFPLPVELSPDAMIHLQKNALYILQWGKLEVYQF